MTKEQTTDLLSDPTTTNIEMAVARCTVKMINDGCVTRLNALTDRWLGKVKEVVMFVPASSTAEDPDTNKSQRMSGLEIVELMKRAQPQCQSQDTKKSTTKRGRSS